METTDPTAETEAERKLPNLFVRLVQVIVSPGRLFRVLSDHPRSWDALILGVLLLATANLLLPLEVWEQTMREQLAQFGGQMPADLTTAARTGKVFGVLGVVLAWPVIALLTAGVYSLIFLFGFGYEGRFRVYFSIVSHALLIAALGGLLLTPLRIWTGSAQFTLNMSAFAPMLEEGLLPRFLRLLDIFNLWVYALVGLGAAVVDDEKEAVPSVAIALGFAVLLTLVIASLIPG